MSASPGSFPSSRRVFRLAPARLGWALLNGVQALYTVLVTCGGIPFALLLRVLSGGARLPLRMAAVYWAPALLHGAGARLQVEGAEQVDWSRPCVLVANHQSIIDACVMFRAVPVPLRFVLKAEMARMPFVGRYARAMGMVFLDRGARRAALQSLEAAAGIVRAGGTVCVFPEGTRSHDRRVGRFKPGAFQIALAAGVPVVPVAIAGSGEVLPPSGFAVRPGMIRLRFGAPLSLPEGDVAAARDVLAQQAERAVADMLQALRGDEVRAHGLTS